MTKRIAVAAVTAVIAAAVYWKLRPSAPAEPDDLPAVRAAYDRTGDPAERARLLRRASGLRESGVARWLAEVAQRDPAAAVQASSALGGIANRDEAGELAEVATGNSPIVVRANAIRALATAGGPAQTAALVALLGDRDQPLRIRQEAALALGALRDPASTNALSAALESDDEQLRISAIQALGMLGARDLLARYTPRSPTERAFVARATR